MSDLLRPSPGLVRAGLAELHRLTRDRTLLIDRLSAVDAERIKLRKQINALQTREQALTAVLGEHKDTDGVIALRGSRLREEAVRVLYATRGTEPTHYRGWYELFVNSGHMVLCVGRPVATFLTAVSRSVIVARDTKAGTYFIDPHRTEGVAQELAEARAELADIDNVIAAEVNPTEALTKHRVALLATIRRHDRHLAEAARCLEGTLETAHPLQLSS